MIQLHKMRASILFAFFCLAVVAVMTTSAEKVEVDEQQEVVNVEEHHGARFRRFTCDYNVGDGPCNVHCKLMGKSRGRCHGKTCVCEK